MHCASMKIRILLPCPPRTKERAWGDYYFGHSLGDALVRLGCKVSYAYKHKGIFSRWWTLLRRLMAVNEIELVIRGRREHRPLARKRAAMWLISQPDSLTDGELRGYEHVFVASPEFHGRIAARCNASSVLLQCTDATRFAPAEAREDGARIGRVLFVGNRRDYAPRPIVDWAIRAGFDVEVWGRGWKGVVGESNLGGLHVENAELAAHYRAASVVLNDHTQDMRDNGFVSNRIYDVLACATPILTEEMEGIDPELRPHLYLYRTPDDVGRQLARALSERAARRGARLQLARTVRDRHSFDARARAILSVLSEHRARAVRADGLTAAAVPGRSAAPGEGTEGRMMGERKSGDGALLALGVTLALAACGQDARPDFALSCQFEVNPPGSYEYPADVLVPTVKPGPGGTQEGADALNACIRRKAAEAGATTVSKPQPGAEANIKRTAQITSPGRLPLPSQYPLEPGDAALWPTLTLEQQQRALLFLQDGSTIRSSLKED